MSRTIRTLLHELDFSISMIELAENSSRVGFVDDFDGDFSPAVLVLAHYNDTEGSFTKFAYKVILVETTGEALTVQDLLVPMV